MKITPELDSYTFLEKLKEMPHRKFVIWSGGKDSTVVLDLARKVLGDVEAVFADGGVEFPETVDYVKRMASEWGLNLTIVRPGEGEDFWTGLEKNGVPTFGNWWCVELLKTRPVSRYLSSLPGPKVRMFGTKATDSKRRARVYPTALVSRGVFLDAYPVLNWTDDEIWDYLRENNIPVNPCYGLYGTSRCWVCPGNEVVPNYLERLGRHHPEFVDRLMEHPELYRRLNHDD